MTQPGPDSGLGDSEAIVPSTPDNSRAGGASALTASSCMEGAELTLECGPTPESRFRPNKTKPPPVISGITLHHRFLPKARFCLQSLNAIREESEPSNIETKIVEHSEDITALLNVLMTLEMQLVEQLEVRWAWVQFQCRNWMRGPAWL